MGQDHNVIRAFGVEQVQRITGLSKTQLRYWDATGFFRTEFAKAENEDDFERVYSFKDVVSLRTLSVLRKTHKISLGHLRKVAESLIGYSDTPWADLKLMVVKKKVVFIEPGTGHAVGATDGQYAMLPIIDVIEHVKKATDDLAIRSKEQIGHFEKNRNVSHNALVVSGTRVPVKAVLGFLKHDFTIQQILNEYPRLTEEDVRAVMRDGGASKAA